MKPLLDPAILIPVFVLILQLFVILYIWAGALKWRKFILTPFSGMEYSQGIFVCSLLLGAILIGIAPLKGLFQVYKTFQNTGDPYVMALLEKSLQFFLVVLFCQILFAGVVWLVSKSVAWAGTGFSEIKEGNLLFSLVVGVVILGFSLVLKTMGEEMIDLIVPRILRFN